MKRLNILSIALCVVGLSIVLSGCNSNNGNENSETQDIKLERPVSNASISGPDTVIISGMKFQPEHLTIHKGDTVVWLNNGIVVHDVTVDSLQSWTSDSIQVGATWSKVPEESFNYFCSIHPTMKGSITVVDK